MWTDLARSTACTSPYLTLCLLRVEGLVQAVGGEGVDLGKGEGAVVSFLFSLLTPLLLLCLLSLFFFFWLLLGLLSLWLALPALLSRMNKTMVVVVVGGGGDGDGGDGDVW